MKLERLVLRRFLTWQELDYEFVDKPLLVQGENLTDFGQASNGSGKSGLQTGIEYCIAATNSREVRDDEIITYGEDSAECELYTRCDVRKQRLHVAWTIMRKGANKLKVRIQDLNTEAWEDVSFSNVADGKKFILSWYAITKEDLFSYFLINKTRFKSFYKSSNRENVDLINRFKDASIIDGLENIEIDELEADYENQKLLISSESGKRDLILEDLERERSRDLGKEMLEEEEAIQEEIEEIEEDIEDLLDEIELLPNKEKSLKEEIEELEEEIEELKVQEKDVEKDQGRCKEDIKDINDQIDLCKAEVDNFKSTDFNQERESFIEEQEEIEGNIEDIEDNVKVYTGKRQSLLNLLSKIETTLSGTITCPNCSHNFLLSEEEDLEEVNSKKDKTTLLEKAVSKKIKSLDEEILELKADKTDIEKSLSKINQREREEQESFNKLSKALNKVERKLNDLEKEYQSYERKISRIHKNISDLESEVKDIQTKIDKISDERKLFNDKISNLKSSIKNKKKEISNLTQENNADTIKRLEDSYKSYTESLDAKEAKLEELEKEIFEIKSWKNNFKQFRTFIANQSLEIIEYHNNRYLKEMKSDLILKLEGFKVLASGNIKEEITAKVIRNYERSFNSFSAGERGKLLFASILANRYMINSSHPYGGLDFLSIDEIFEGIDGVGLKYLMRSISQYNFPIMVITHVTDEYTSQDVLKIVKRNNISKIEE